jgi:hypothetical protein
MLPVDIPVSRASGGFLKGVWKRHVCSITPKRSLEPIEQLISKSTNDEIKEHRSQKHLLTNRKAVYALLHDSVHLAWIMYNLCYF